jgi:hypothetical protein
VNDAPRSNRGEPIKGPCLDHHLVAGGLGHRHGKLFLAQLEGRGNNLITRLTFGILSPSLPNCYKQDGNNYEQRQTKKMQRRKRT